jgi:chitin disaccharide deacetylase
MRYRNILVLLLVLCSVHRTALAQQTFAEKLGFPKNAKVLILHVDDVGMSLDSNEGAIQAMERGVANSLSIMMPCPWVPGFFQYLKTHPQVDAGLHLTLTSEWSEYRWGPLTGKPSSPGLVDEEGALWSSVEDVVKHASADEVENEIRAQLDRARSMGFEPTHLDSHMGTLFATPEFLQRYVKVGIENKIPVMFPAGHNTMISATSGFSAEAMNQIKQTGQLIWNSGLPVLDDLHNVSYGFGYDKSKHGSEEAHRKFATENYIKTIKELKPGLTMVIMHCTSPTEVFPHISTSGHIRKGDLLAMTDPAFKKFLQDEGIILTTWREVMLRRSKIK